MNLWYGYNNSIKNTYTCRKLIVSPEVIGTLSYHNFWRMNRQTKYDDIEHVVRTTVTGRSRYREEVERYDTSKIHVGFYQTEFCTRGSG